MTCKHLENNTKEILTWDQDDIRKALDLIQDKRIHLAIHMSFPCTMRIGEVTGLHWKYIDLENDKIYVRQIIQRVTKESLRLLKPKIFLLFLDKLSNSKSSLVLKEPKTKSSIRDLHIPPALKKEINQKFQESFYGESENSSQKQKSIQAMIDTCSKDSELAQQLLDAFNKTLECEQV